MKRTTDKKKIDEDYEELLIRVAMNKYAEEEGRKLLKENDELQQNDFYLPSQTSKTKFQRSIKRHYQRNSFIGKLRIHSNIGKVAIIIVMFIVVIFSISVVSVQAFRMKIFNFFVEMKNDYTQFGLSEQSEIVIATYQEGDYAIETPRGYSLIHIQRMASAVTATYKNKNNDILIFEQSTNRSLTNLDTEDAEQLEETKVSNYKALLNRKDKVLSLIWSNNERIFYISSNSEQIAREDLIHLGNSVKLW